MSTTEVLLVVAAVLGALSLCGACVCLFAAASRLQRAAVGLEEAAGEFVARADPLVGQLASSADAAAGEVARVENILDISTGIAERLDGTTGATYRAITTPVIKGAAFAAGTKRAARRLGGRTGH